MECVKCKYLSCMSVLNVAVTVVFCLFVLNREIYYVWLKSSFFFKFLADHSPELFKPISLSKLTVDH